MRDGAQVAEVYPQRNALFFSKPTFSKGDFFCQTVIIQISTLNFNEVISLWRFAEKNPCHNDEMDYSTEERKAKLFYKKLGRPLCPGVKGYVAFTSSGFRHLLLKHGERRSEKERIWRFGLLVAAENIIKSPKKEITVSRRTDVARDGVSKIRYWALTKRVNGQITKVIIRQFENGQKHFYSVH